MKRDPILIPKNVLVDQITEYDLRDIGEGLSDIFGTPFSLKFTDLNKLRSFLRNYTKSQLDLLLQTMVLNVDG